MATYFQTGAGRTEQEAQADFYRNVAQRHQVRAEGITLVSEKYLPESGEGTIVYRGAYTLTSSSSSSRNGTHKNPPAGGLETRTEEGARQKKPRVSPRVEDAAGTGPSLVARVRILPNPFE